MTLQKIRIAHPPRDKPVMLYDGECAFCCRWIARWRRLTGDTMTYLSAAEGAGRFPEIPEEDLAGAAHLIDVDGCVYAGAEAVVRSLALRPGRGWLLWCYLRVPGIAPLSRVVYQWIARHRRRL